MLQLDPLPISMSVLTLLLVWLASASAMAPDSSPSARKLRAQHLDNPLGIDIPEPLLSWQFAQEGRSRLQGAYHIQAATSTDLLRIDRPNLWDSGRVDSATSTGVPYGGERVASGVRCWWRVKVWDREGRAGAWSEPAFFEMGLLRNADWQGDWITTPICGNGYHSGMEPNADVTKWVQVDLLEEHCFRCVRLFPAQPYNWNEDTPGFGFPVRYKLEASNDPSFASATTLANRANDDQPNPGENPVTLEFEPVKARYLRLTVNRLYTRIDGHKLFAMAEIHVVGDDGTNLAIGKPVTALDSTEAHGWSTEFLTEGITESVAPSRIAPHFRREFTLDEPVRSARVYVCGLGYYELYLNGERVGDRVLEPSYTNFETRALYSTYDVTAMLKEGANAVGAIMGKGWYGRSPALVLQLNVERVDGTRTSIFTDDRWKRAYGPITENSLYHGETYDAGKELTGWALAGYDETAWEPVTVTPPRTENLTAQMIQPIRVVETLQPQSITEPKEGVWVFDFGQNFSGWCRLRASAPEGSMVSLRHAELLYDDGTINAENLRAARATDHYTFGGNAGSESYEPRFTYHGFRYAQLEGLAAKPDESVLAGKVVHTDFGRVGDFQCSSDLINQIHKNSVWGFRTNFHSIPTDCPQRDERQGWMGDAGMTADMACYNFDVAAAYSKFLQDIADAQGDDGRIPDTVPHIWGSNPGDPMWAGAYHFIIWDVYRHTGDRMLLAKHYDGLKKYVDMLVREAPDFILTRNNYGDWVGVAETPKDLISTGSFYLVSRIVSRIATVLDRDADATAYDALCGRIAAAFNSKFFDPETNIYGNGSQYSYVWPLFLGIVPEDRRKAVVDRLVEDIMVTHKGHLSTGFLGARYMFEVLCREGRPDVAYTILSRRDYPSYGYMLEMGATTIWELWKYETGNSMNSHNHPAFGFISGWFFRNIAGIVPDWRHAGYERFDVKPHPMGELTEARASVETVRGKVESQWKRTGDTIALEVTVPANSAAGIWVPKPARGKNLITETGSPVWNGNDYVSGCEGVAAASDEGDWIRFEVGSGSYSFQAFPLEQR